MRRVGLAVVLLVGAVAVAQERPFQPVPQPGGQPPKTAWPPQPGVQPAVATVPGAQPAPGGQPAPQPAAPDAVTLQHLKGWETAMKDMKTFAVKADMTVTDKATARSEKFKGDIWCMAPNLTRLNLEKQLPPNVKPTGEEFMAFICNGKVVFHYDGAAKTVTVAKVGPNGAGNNLLLDIMAGMTAQNAVARFEIQALKPLNPNDPYIYLELKPRWKEDKTEFESMQLILIPPAKEIGNRAYLPRRVKVFKPGGQKVEEWDFPDPKVNPAGIEAKHFQGEKPPGDWKVQQADLPQADPKAPGQPGGLVAPPPPPKR